MILEQGISGSVTWEYFDNGELVFRPVNDIQGTLDDVPVLKRQWNEIKADLIRFEKGVKANNGLSYMFYKSQAKVIDLSNLDTSDTTIMRYMFSNTSAKLLNLSSLNTSNVTNMNCMFYKSSEPLLDLSGFDTSNVTTMEYMFCESKITSLDLSNFTIHPNLVAHDMFAETNLQELILQNNEQKELLISKSGLKVGK